MQDINNKILMLTKEPQPLPSKHNVIDQPGANGRRTCIFLLVINSNFWTYLLPFLRY